MQLIQEAKATLDARRKEVTIENMRDYGAEALYDKIEEYDRKIDHLKKELRERGWSTYNRMPVAGDEAGRRIEKQLEPEKEKIRSLIALKQRIIEEVWTADTVADIPVVSG